MRTFRFEWNLFRQVLGVGFAVLLALAVAVAPIVGVMSGVGASSVGVAGGPSGDVAAGDGSGGGPSTAVGSGVGVAESEGSAVGGNPPADGAPTTGVAAGEDGDVATAAASINVTGVVNGSDGDPAVDDTVRATDGSGATRTNGTGAFALELPTTNGSYDLAYLQANTSAANATWARDGSPDVFGLARVNWSISTDVGSVDIVPERGLSTANTRHHTKLVAIEPLSNLTLDDGTNYHFLFTNEDSGESVTVALDGSVELEARDNLGFLTYDPDGSVRPDPELWPIGITSSQPMTLVNGSIPPASGLTNFSVTLVNASTGAEIDSTATQPSVVGYEGVLAQNSTTGTIRISIPRDVLPPTANATLRFSKGNFSDSSPVFESAVEYDPATDSFVSVVDASNYSAGTYGWKANFDWRGVDRVLKFMRPDSSHEQNITIEGENVTISQTRGASTGNDRFATKLVGIEASRNLTLDNGTNYHFRLTDEDGGQSITLALDGAVELGAGDPLNLVVFRPDGSPSTPPTLWPPRQSGLMEADVVNGSAPDASGLTNFSVTLLDAATGAVLARTGTEPSVVGYEGVLAQNSTTGSIRLSLPRDVLPRDSTGTVELETETNHYQFPMTYDDGADEFVTVVDAGNLSAGNYTWVTEFDWHGTTRILRAADENITIGERDDANVTGRVVRAGGAPATDDTVVDPGVLTDEVRTNATGGFEVPVPSNSTTSLGYYQGNFSTGVRLTSEDDGSPDLYALENVTVGDTDVGTVSLPQGHNLTVTVANESGVAVADARVQVLHRNPTGSERFGTGVQTTDARGRLVLANADHPGVEMANDTFVHVQPPAGDPRFVDTTYRFEPAMDAPRHLNVTLNETGNVTVSGRVVLANGSGAASDQVVLLGGGVREGLVTGSDGSFSVSLPPNTTYDVAYRQGDHPDGKAITSLDDGSPDLLSVRKVEVGTADRDLGNVTLPTAYQLNVSVTDEAGDPVENARVHVDHENTTSGLAVGFSGRTTNTDGLLDIDGAPAPGVEVVGDVAVVVRPPEDDPRFEDRSYRRDIVVSADDTVSFELNETSVPTNNVTGRVVEADGSPAAGDNIDIENRSTLDSTLVTTNATGHFAASVPYNGTFDVILEQQNETNGGTDSERDGTTDIYVLARRDVTDDIDLGTVTLPAGHLVNVSVVNGSGVPLPDVKVRISHQPDYAPDAGIDLRIKTNEDGLLQPNADVAPGVELAGQVRLDFDPPDGSAYEGKTFELNVTSDRRLNVTLNRTFVVSGRVVEADGNPGDGNFVIAAARDDPDVDTEGKLTDGDGTFLLGGLAESVPYHFAYYQSGLSDDFPADGSPDFYAIDVVNTTTDVDLGNVSLPPAHTLNVTVLNESGAPVENASVDLVHNNSATDARTGLGASTRPDGMIEVGNTTGVEVVGDVAVTVGPPANATAKGFVNQSYERNLSVSNDTRVNVTLNETHVVSGRVEGPNGSAAVEDGVSLDGVDVSVSEFTTTNTTGHFAKGVPRNGTYDVVLIQRNETAATETERDGSPDVYVVARRKVTGNVDLGTVTLPQGHLVNVSVVDESGAPIPNVSVFFTPQPSHAPDASGGFELETNDDGLLQPNPAVPPGVELAGRVELSFDPPDGSGYEMTEKTLNVTSDRDLTVTLEDANVISGRIEEADGSPAVQDHLQILHLEGVANLLNHTDSNGQFAVNAPANGTYRVTFFQHNESIGLNQDTERDGSPDVFVFENTTVTDDTNLGTLTLPSAHLLNLSVENETGTPLSNVVVSIVHQPAYAPNNDLGVTLETTSDGVLQPNPAVSPGVEVVGRIRIELDPPDSSGYARTVRELNVTSDRTVTIVPNESRVVTGRLEDTEGNALEGDFVFARSTSHFRRNRTEFDGSYLLSIPDNETYGVTFIQENESTGRLSKRDGVADLALVANRSFATDTDLGPTVVPDGHVVNVTVVDESDAPVEDASVVFTPGPPGLDENSTSGLDLNTTASGLVHTPNGNPGLELAGNVTITVSRPEGDDRFVDREYTRNITVTNSQNLTVPLEEKPRTRPYSVTTPPPTNVTADSATLHANLTGLGGADNATVHVKYWVLDDGPISTTWLHRTTLDAPGTVAANATGLASNTTYVAQAVARTPSGNWTAGDPKEFTTPTPFGVDTRASNVTADSATLHANLTGLGGAANATVHLKYWPAGDAVNTTWVLSRTLDSPRTVTATATGLASNTTYRTQAVAQDATGEWTAGPIVGFTTPEAVAVTTAPATGVNASAATLRGNLTALGDSASADVQFKYWVQGDPANASFTPFRTRSTPGAFTETVTGLAPNTTYVVRAQARDDGGTYATGGTEAFVTTAAAFDVTTTGASNVTDATATFEGDLAGLGGAASADVQFKYWVQGDPANASFTPFRTRSTPGAFTESVTGLAPNTTYAFRAQARDPSGVYDAGATETVTTATAFAVATTAPTNVTATAATFGGDLVGLGSASSADVQFKYWVQGDPANASFTPARTRTATGPFTERATGLSPTTTYVVQVIARSSEGEWVAGSEVTVTTGS